VNILYVEDDPLDADLTRRELLKASPQFRLDIVGTVRDAIARLEQSSYDIVLTDMRLPDGDGLALLAHVRQHAMSVVVVLTTGSGDEEIAVAALKAGADDYVVKRADYVARLPATLENALERHRAETARRARPLRVLYAEDNAVDIDLTRRHLARHAPHIRLDVANTAAGMYQHLEQGAPGAYDVLLLDYRLPGVSALELLGKVRREHGLDVPVVLVTGQGNEEIAVQALRLGAADYVVKTADYLHKLPWALESAFHRAQLTHEQAALRESEKKYRELVDNSLVGIYVTQSHILKFCNQQFAEIFGYASAQDMVGKHVKELVAPASWELVDTEVRLRESGQKVFSHYEFMGVRKDGRMCEIEVLGSHTIYEGNPAIQGTLIDITLRKQAEEEIRKLNQDLERRAKGLIALNQASRAIASTLNLESVLKLVMEQVKNLLDAEGASVLLRDPLSGELVFAASTGGVTGELTGMRMPITAGVAGWVVRERQPVIVADVQKDSRFYDQIDAVTGLTTRSVVAVPLIFGGAVWGVVEAVNKTCAAFDEHDLEMLEALAGSAAIAVENAQLYSSLQAANTRLQTALQAKDEMIRNVSHELRTPLGVIYGYISLLESGELGALAPQQERAAQALSLHADRLRFMVERLLALQSLDSEKMRWEQLDVGQWLRQAVRPWEARAAKAGIQLRLEVSSLLPPLIADPDFMGQVIDNLLDNAIKFSPRGGEVRVRARAEGNEAVIAVSDNGIGIPPDKLQQVFERFYQVDSSTARRYGGMGIGLALCRAIVDVHSGRIWAESEGSGHGSTFYVALPAMTTGKAAFDN